MGRALVASLEADGHDVVVVTRSPGGAGQVGWDGVAARGRRRRRGRQPRRRLDRRPALDAEAEGPDPLEPRRHDARAARRRSRARAAAARVRHRVGHRLRGRRGRRGRRRGRAVRPLVPRRRVRGVGGGGCGGAGAARRGADAARDRPGRRRGAADGAALPPLRRRPPRRRPAVVPVDPPRRPRARLSASRSTTRACAGPIVAVAPQLLRQRDAARDFGAVLHRPSRVPDAGAGAAGRARRAGRPAAARPARGVAAAERLRVPLPRAAGCARRRRCDRGGRGARPAVAAPVRAVGRADALARPLLPALAGRSRRLAPLLPRGLDPRHARAARRGSASCRST